MIQKYLSALEHEINAYSKPTEPVGLYEPIAYILNLPGKRIRPVLSLMAAELFGNFNEAIHVAMAVEVFHNFTLLHDDIMDEAPLRRGHQTVHHKWDLNTGILSGDALLIKAYQHLSHYESGVLTKLFKVFNQTALEVCEGQQWDVEFEQKNNVTKEDYLKMIQFKTAVLLGCALQMGAIVKKADDRDTENLYQFGLLLGTAFQIQDDYLDCFGNPETFGKQIGGDIIENKKTILYIMAQQLCNHEDLKILNDLYNTQPENTEQKIIAVKEIFEKSGVVDAALELVKYYTEQTFSYLDKVNVDKDKKQPLFELANYLMNRNQ